jgi:subtilisin family serine protease
MPRRGAGLVIVLTLWLALAGLGLHASTAAPVVAGGDPGREVLVLLRLAPEHFRPGADYSDSYDDAMARAARRRIADRLAHSHGLALIGDWPMPLVGVDCFIMIAPPGRSTDEAAKRLSLDPAVSWAEPVRLYKGEGSRPSKGSGDPLFQAQPAAREWRLADLHEIATGRNVTVAVIDSAVERTHPDLIGQIVLSENFVADHPTSGENHGTGVAGVIAAVADNGIGIAGVAPGARLMALRACWQAKAASAESPTTVCDSLSLAQALHFAIEHNAGVVNLSLAGPTDPLLARLIDVAIARRLTVVAAFDPDMPHGGFPASHAGVVAVADESMTVAAPGVYLAPGRDVPTTEPGGRWFLVDGSSYAAAHVSGLFALLREHTRAIAPLTLVLGDEGSRRVDACASLLRVVGPCHCACAKPLGAMARR